MTSVANLETIAVMFEELAVARPSDHDNNWRNGYRDGLTDAYTMCAETIRREIRIQQGRP